MLSFIISSCSPITKKHASGAKPLLKMANGESLLQYQVGIIKQEFPDSEIILTVGFEADKVIKHARGVRIIENINFKNTHSEDIRLALNAMSGDELVYISGDMIFNKSALGIINGHSSLLIDTQSTMDENDVGVSVIDDAVTIISYGIKSPKWGRVAFFTKKDTELLKELLNEKQANKKMFFEIINELIDIKYRSMRAVEPKNTEIKVYS